jgi:hypothetical protein
MYPIYNHNWRNNNTICTYNKTSIKRNILTIKQNTSGSRSGEGLIITPVENAKPFLTIQLIQLNLLTSQYTAVTLRNTRFSTQKSYTPKFKNSTWCSLCIFCVLYGSQDKQGLLSYTELTGCIGIIEVEAVYCAVRTEWLHKTDFVFKGLTASETTRCQFENQHKYRGSTEVRQSYANQTNAKRDSVIVSSDWARTKILERVSNKILM